MPPNQQDSLYKAVFDGCSDAIYVIEPSTSQVLDGNPRAWIDLGMSRDELLSHSVISLQNDVESEEHWRLIVNKVYLSGSLTFIGRHRRNNGSGFPVEVYTSIIRHQDRDLFVSIARNLALTSQQREEFRDHDAKLTYALNEAVDGMWDWHIETGEVFFSPQLKRMLGYLPHEMEAEVSSWIDSIYPDDRERVLALMDEHLNGRIPQYEAEYRIYNRDKQLLWVRDRGRVCQHDEQGAAVRIVGMVHDITAAKALEDKLRQQASYDYLTGLLNRRAGYIHFKKQLSYAQRYQQSFTLCLLDLDHFKGINDEFGHLAGDRVLKHFVELMSLSIRQSDTLMRWGGEEFLLLLPKTDTVNARHLIEQLQEKTTQSPILLDGCEVRVAFSAGLATYPEHARDMDGLISSADEALYSAKNSGRNQVVVSQNSTVLKQQELFL
ncbi:sensor domain-containing diguanylate cyclase [Amphritea sp. HPY]|uniref:sensor domain-containing diguanylate cyclase n=1 Tax=Amphritea sp. HPY TaxID=3421652 RepID=UPI003D7C8226